LDAQLIPPTTNEPDIMRFFDNITDPASREKEYKKWAPCCTSRQVRQRRDIKMRGQRRAQRN
jgi:hypothetical protein